VECGIKDVERKLLVEWLLGVRNIDPVLHLFNGLFLVSSQSFNCGSLPVDILGRGSIPRSADILGVRRLSLAREEKI